MFKWSINERLKHCIIGLTLILSIIVVVFPSLLKNEAVSVDDSVFSSGHRPPTPKFAEVNIPNKEALFKRVKVAYVDIQKPNTKIRSLARDETEKRVPRAEQLAAQVALASQKSDFKNEQYAVQLASFSQLHNAITLAQTLKEKGFSAYYNKQGKGWRVLVGQMNKKNEALNLQQKLARLQLSGYVIKLG